MSATRYEILLPLTYNDGSDVEPEKFLATKRELTERFGAVTVDPNPLHGTWVHAGTSYEDALLKFVVDVDPDTGETAAFLERFKETLKERFDQLDIWIVGIPIRII